MALQFYGRFRGIIAELSRLEARSTLTLRSFYCHINTVHFTVMSRTKVAVITIGAAVLLLALFGIFKAYRMSHFQSPPRHLAQNEPVYKGKTLSEWLENLHAIAKSYENQPAKPRKQPALNQLANKMGFDFSPEPAVQDNPDLAKARKETEFAIQQIGTNALPFLIATLKAQDSPQKLQFYDVNTRKPLPTNEVEDVVLAGFRLQGRATIPILKPALSDSTASVKTKETALLVMVFGGDEGLDPLLEACENQDPHIQWVAMLHLAQNLEIRPADQKEAAFKKALPTLVRHIEDPNAQIRSRVASVFSHCKDRGLVIPYLIKFLDDSTPSVVAISAKTLGEFGVDGKSALPKLEELAAGTTREAKAAKFAVRKINAEIAKSEQTSTSAANPGISPSEAK